MPERSTSIVWVRGGITDMHSWQLQMSKEELIGYEV